MRVLRRECEWLALIGLAILFGSGCATGLKRDLEASRGALTEAKRERAALEAQIQQTVATLRTSQAQLADAQEQLRVSAARLEELRAEARSDTKSLSEQIAACESRRLQLENSDIGILDRDIRLCREEQPRAFAAGVAQGKLALLEALQVIGTAEQQCAIGSVWCDYYYRFEVKVGSRTFVLTKIETERAENPLATTLSAVGGLAQAIAALVR